jgi:hypothetical protein
MYNNLIIKVMKSIYVITAVLATTVIFSSCAKDEMDQTINSDLKSANVYGVTATHVFTKSVDDLTTADIAGLMQMREEEKMARDVYDFFYETYGTQVFDQISNSENRHMESVLSLINHFGLTDPATTEAGVFTNSEIQTLYNQLTAAGSSVELALSTGAFIEEYDIADLKTLLAETKNADIIMVYTNLEKGSENHLRAFATTLLNYGVTYEPQILTSEVYAEILLSTNSQGKGNKRKEKQGNAGIGAGNSTPIDVNGDGICDVTGLPITQNQGNATQSNSNGGKGNGRNGNGNKR